MTPTNTFYVYAHYVPCSPDPFYVGKGRGKRAWHFYNRSRWWKNSVAKHCPAGKPEVRMLAEGLTEEDAFYVERFWIAVFGRKNVCAEGCLINLTDGGEGPCGMKLSSETRRKMSERMKGENNPMFGKKGPEGAMYGRKHNPDVRAKIVEARKAQGPASEETKIKQSEAKKGEKNPFFGRTHSEESRARMTEGQRKRHLRARLRRSVNGSVPP